MRRAVRAACGMLIGLVVACGDDSGTEPPASDAGPEAGMDGGGPFDAGSDAGAVDAAVDGGTLTPIPPLPPIVCGDVTCPRPPGQEWIDFLGSFGLPVSGGGFFRACCTEQDACGLIVRSLDSDGGFVTATCVARPESDPRCPDRNLLGVDQPGCCVEETGMCGVNGEQVGGGCIDLSDSPVAPFLGFTAITCEGFEDDGGADGG